MPTSGYDHYGYYRVPLDYIEPKTEVERWFYKALFAPPVPRHIVADLIAAVDTIVDEMVTIDAKLATLPDDAPILIQVTAKQLRTLSDTSRAIKCWETEDRRTSSTS